MYCHWATMSDDRTDFILVPFHPLPCRYDDKEFIRKHIVNADNDEIRGNSKVMKLLREVGSDLMINTFVCNFRNRDGRPNENIVEANYMNQKIFEAFSLRHPDDKPFDFPLILTSTELRHDCYKERLTELKAHL